MGVRAEITEKTTEKRRTKSISQTTKNHLFKPTYSLLDQTTFLQRNLGNQAFHHFYPSRAIHPQLKIGEPNDQYEQEADRVADEVMRIREGEVQRKCADCAIGKKSCSECSGEENLPSKPLPFPVTTLVQRDEEEFEEDEEIVQAKIEAGHCQEDVFRLNSKVDLLNSQGKPLPDSVRSYFEPAFGVSFENVRIHDDHRAAEAAKKINARAFTQGVHIGFGDSKYSPETESGKRLLAHELVHTIQQSPSRQYSTSLTYGSDRSPTLQRKEALESNLASGAPGKTVGESKGSVVCPENGVRECNNNLVPELTGELEKAVEFVDNAIKEIRVDDFANSGEPKTVKAFEQLFGTPDPVNIGALANNLAQVLRTLHRTDLLQSIPEADPAVVCADDECVPRCKQSRAIYDTGRDPDSRFIILCDNYIKDKKKIPRIATLVHEAAHAALHRTTIDVYSYTRLFRLLKDLEAPGFDIFDFMYPIEPLYNPPLKPVTKKRRDPAFNNPDTIATFVLIANGVGPKAAIPKGLAPKDIFFGSLKTDDNLKKNAELIVALTEQHIREGKEYVERALIDVKAISESNELWEDRPLYNRITMWMLRDPGFIDVGLDEITSSARCGPNPTRFGLGCPADGRSARKDDLSTMQTIDKELGELVAVFRTPILIGNKNSKDPPLNWIINPGKTMVGFWEDFVLFPPILFDIQYSVRNLVEAKGLSSNYADYLIDNFERRFERVISLF